MLYRLEGVPCAFCGRDAAAASSRSELECADDRIECCIGRVAAPALLAGAASRRPSKVIGFTPKDAMVRPPEKGMRKGGEDEDGEGRTQAGISRGKCAGKHGGRRIRLIQGASKEISLQRIHRLHRQ